MWQLQLKIVSKMDFIVCGVRTLFR